MRNWNWEINERRTPIAHLQIDFAATYAALIDLRDLVPASRVSGFVLAAPKAVASLGLNSEGADFWVDAGSYRFLPFFKGQGYYGSYYDLVITQTRLSCEFYGNDPTSLHEVAMRLIVSLLNTSNLRVEHWKVWAGSWDDPPVDVAQGGHEELLKYLQIE